MPGFADTIDLERSLLKHLVSSKVFAQKYMRSISEDVFSTGARKFIFRIARQKFKDTKSLLSDKVFLYEIGIRVDKKKEEFYQEEWNMIKGTLAEESIDIILEELDKAIRGVKMTDLLGDAADLVGKGEIDEAETLVKKESFKFGRRGKDVPVKKMTDFEARKKRIEDIQQNPHKYAGLKTGFARFDKKTGGLFPSELTLIAALTGVGKSTFIKAIEKGVLLNNPGKNILHITNEENQIQVEQKLDALFSGIPFTDLKLASVTVEQMKQWEDKMIELRNSKCGEIYVKEVPAFSNVTEIEKCFYELKEQGIKIHLICIDYLDNLAPVEKAWSENDEQAKAAADVKELAKSLNIPVVIAAQAATELEKKQEKGRAAGRLDVYGSKKKIHPANTFMIIVQGRTDEKQTDREEWERDVFWSVQIKKNRDGPVFSFDAKVAVKTGDVKQIGIEAGASAGSSNTQMLDETVEEAEAVKKERGQVGGLQNVADALKKMRMSFKKSQNGGVTKKAIKRSKNENV